MAQQITLGNHLCFGMTNHYKEWKQWIIGITLNKEKEEYSDDYDKAPHRVNNKYEFNIWLIFIGLHMTIRGKSKLI